MFQLLTGLPFSLILATNSFMATFLFLLAITFACTPLTLGSLLSSAAAGAGAGARLLEAAEAMPPSPSPPSSSSDPAPAAIMPRSAWGQPLSTTDRDQTQGELGSSTVEGVRRKKSDAVLGRNRSRSRRRLRDHGGRGLHEGSHGFDAPVTIAVGDVVSTLYNCRIKA
uniref:Uncharacterized protein n=1 Tax=Oryza brachyantha TaxID=4533 RepID=J3MZ85_ORYBR